VAARVGCKNQPLPSAKLKGVPLRHGTCDDDVDPPTQSIAFDALTQEGFIARIIVVSGATHFLSPILWMKRAAAASLDRVLRSFAGAL
jgi:hypothetical protein